MPLEDQINHDYLNAYKARDEIRVSVLRMLKSALKNLSIEKRIELNDNDVVKTLRKETKQRQEAIVEYERAGRNELAQKEKSEIEILSIYLPAEIDEQELVGIIDQTIKELNAGNISQAGLVIGAVIKKIGGSADGSKVSQLVRNRLQ